MVQLPSVSEGEYSQTLAALDERAKRLTDLLENAKTEPVTIDRDTLIDHVVDALHWTNMARLRLSEVDEGQVPPDQMTWTQA